MVLFSFLSRPSSSFFPTESETGFESTRSWFEIGWLLDASQRRHSSGRGSRYVGTMVGWMFVDFLPCSFVIFAFLVRWRRIPRRPFWNRRGFPKQTFRRWLERRWTQFLRLIANTPPWRSHIVRLRATRRRSSEARASKEEEHPSPTGTGQKLFRAKLVFVLFSSFFF